MARPLILSNGQMHVGLNVYGLVHDFYYPFVGLDNHAAAKNLRHRIGVFVDGSFSWLDDGAWDIAHDYYGEVLVTQIVAIHSDLQVRLEFDDCVDSEFTAFLRNIHIVNMADSEREIRLFMHQVFDISDSHTSDTVQYLPSEHGILHYKGHRVFFVNGVHADGSPFDTYSVGLFNTEGHEGTYRDAEDGELMTNSVEHGLVDSVIGFHLQVRAHSSRRIHYWISAGRSEREALKISQTIQTDGLLHHLLKTANWWSSWIKPAQTVAKKLPEAYRHSFIRSALIIKAQTDKHGAVIASTDTAMLKNSRDTYVYCWPRDAAYVLWPLMRIGYVDELLNFFAFARRSLHEGGYLSHKYMADGAVGSSWHPYTVHDDFTAPPIQTDETASVLFLFGQYYRLHPEEELLTNFYVTLVKPMANFLAGYVDQDGLPRPSYDLWEEKHLTTTYTTAVTFAALGEAAYLADVFGDKESAIRWQSAAETMHEKRDVFYNQDRKYFHKGYVVTDGKKQFDETIDASSLYGVFMFGYFDSSDETLTQAFKTLQSTIMDETGRVIRYEGDTYHRRDDRPSNPWPVTSLWMSQYALENNDSELAHKALDWVRERMFDSGVIAEQYAVDDQLLSVAPLAWSQAEYMSVLLDMITDPGTAS